MNGLINKGLLTAILAIVFTSCSMGPDFVRPTIDSVATYSADREEGESIVNLPWWELFGDTVLQRLVTEALENNRDLRSSMARINEARATLGIIRSDMYPSVDFATGAGLGEFGSRNTLFDDPTAQFVASYEVDLWGRVSRSNEAAVQELLGTREAYRGVTIALISEVANSYLLLRDIDNRLLVSENTAEAWRKSLNVIMAKYRAGIISEVDVNQAKIQLVDAEAMFVNFERMRGQIENTISMLLSRSPVSIERGLALNEQIFPPVIPIGVPSDLLNRRPDLLEAERKLHAQTARIGVAEALKYPQLKLGADMGATFINPISTFAGIGALIAGPLFNAGKNQSQVDAEIARTELLLNRYEQTFFTALRDVENAIIAVNTYKKEYELRKNQVEFAQNATDLSWGRYEGGMTSYLEVLDVQRSLFTAELISSETLQKQLSSIVRLYSALGGGWIPEQDSTGVGQSERNID